MSGNHADRGVLWGPLEDEMISKPSVIEKHLIRKDSMVAPALAK